MGGGTEETGGHKGYGLALVVEILTGQMEHHISADVAYAVWQYWRATGDDDFFLRAGAEILWRAWQRVLKQAAENAKKRIVTARLQPQIDPDKLTDEAIDALDAQLTGVG